MGGIDVALRVAGGAVAYLAVGVVVAEVLDRLDRRLSRRKGWTISRMNPDERGAVVLLWPVFAALGFIVLGIPLMLEGIGRAAGWLCSSGDARR